MVTTKTPSPEPEKHAGAAEEEHEEEIQEGEAEAQPTGFFSLLVKSVFEPGANKAVVLAMNLSFFFLLITLFGLAFLTDWNLHVLMLMLINLILWIAMVWFVMQLTAVQANPENMPVADNMLVPDEAAETRKDK